MQYLSVQKVSEISGYSISALSRWARDGRIPAERDKNNCWYIQYPFPESFRPVRAPYTRRKATLDVVIAAPAAPAPDPEMPALEPEPVPDTAALGYTMDDVARAMMELVSYAHAQTHLQEQLVKLLDNHRALLDTIVTEQRRLADAWEKPSTPSNNTGGLSSFLRRG